VPAHASAFGLVAGSDHAYGGAVPLAAGSASGDSRGEVEARADWFQGCELLEGGVRAGVFVAVDDHVGLAAAPGDGHGYELVDESAGIVGGARALLGLAGDSSCSSRVMS
jgi:hypothetical protein